MLKRTLYFGNPSYLSTRNEQLVLKLPEVVSNPNMPHLLKKEAEISIPIEDIGMVILDHSRITITHDLGEKLLANNAAIVWCDSKHHPTGLTLSLAHNDTFSEKARYQIDASEPQKKQLWKQTIEAKIANQAAILEKLGFAAQDLRFMQNQVLSGDTGNHESRAAVMYWKRLLEKYGVNRGQHEGPPNNLLNYSYAVLRAVAARSLVESGLLPVLGMHHKNKYNAYCLADDIMEPYRPIADYHVFSQLKNGFILTDQLTNDQKTTLLNIINIDVEIDGRTSPLQVAMQRTTSSLMRCYMGEIRKLNFPTPIL